jgi:hypothetical protein
VLSGWPTFWEDFWPNFAATAAGIILGLPLAFWINRHAARLGERNRRDAEKSQVANVLHTIELAIRANGPRLDRFAKVLANRNTLFDTGLDTSAWEAVQGILNASFNTPDLRQRLAYHFSRLAAVVQMNSRLVGYSAGIESALADVGAPRAALVQALQEGVAALEKETPVLIDELSQARSALISKSDAPQTSPPNTRLKLTARVD